MAIGATSQERRSRTVVRRRWRLSGGRLWIITGLMFALARRNRVRLPYANAAAVRSAYQFRDLQSFLEVYYPRTCSVLIHERDLCELTREPMTRGMPRASVMQIFFDPESHTTSQLIMCFCDLPVDDALATLEDALAHGDLISRVGLDSAEIGNPPDKFRRVCERAMGAGLRTCACR